MKGPNSIRDTHHFQYQGETPFKNVGSVIHISFCKQETHFNINRDMYFRANLAQYSRILT